MAKFSERELLEMTHAIVVSAVGAPRGDKLAAFQDQNGTTGLIQAVYDKLKEINDSIEG